MFDSFIESISCEISEIKKSRKKKYINVEYYKELSKFSSNYFVYEIYVSEYVSKMSEDLSIELTSRNHKLDVVIINIDENQIIKIKTKEKLTEEIYRINMEFDPSFLLKNLSTCIEKVKNTENSIVNSLKNISLNEKIEIDTYNLEYKELNESQIKAIQHSEENQISLIWGPPGTGKTHTLSKIIYRSFLRDEKALVLSTSNVALDQILLKLDKDIYEEEKKYILRLGNTNNQVIYEYTSDSNNYKKQEKNIIFSTLANLSMKYDKLGDFDLVVIDEVSMVSLPYVFIAGNKSKKNLVLLGDFRQLPPISLNKINNLFQLSIYDYLDVPKKIDNKVNIPYMSMLDTQYRMTQSISTLISKLFYNNLLKCGVEEIEHQNTLNFINIDDSEYLDTYFSISDKSYFNPISLFLVDSLIEKVGEDKEFLVMSPFRPQQNMLNGYFRDREDLNGRSLTVHKAQGSEADIVIFDLTTHLKSNKMNYHHFFISDITKNLVNVAISRAKEQIYIIGSLEMINQLSKEFSLWSKIKNNILNKFQIINSTEWILNRKEEDFLIDTSSIKKFTIIDTKCKKNFFDSIKKLDNIETRNYIANEGCIPTIERKGVTFRDLKNSDKLPEMLFIDDKIILNEGNKYFSISLEKTSKILHRIALESFISSPEITRSSTYILNCERCGEGTFQIKIRNNNVVFACSKCINTKRIGKKEMDLIQNIYKLKCYDCGAKVTPRKGEKGFYFFGCMNYPACKGTISLYTLCI